jgi:hypothetical protein
MVLGAIVLLLLVVEGSVTQVQRRIAGWEWTAGPVLSFDKLSTDFL